MEHLFVVGAGFSAHAGLPLASAFTDHLLSKARISSVTDAALIEVIRQFVTDVFNTDLSADPIKWPVVEDVFTSIDLAANTGHNLGRSYSPSMLRTVRRALIVRLIRMLRLSYLRGKSNGGTDWNNLAKFFEGIDVEQSSFLSMNWDTVIEDGLAESQSIRNIDYGNSAFSARFGSSKLKRVLFKPTVRKATILKPHGSVNWLYCDCCSRLFWFNTSSTREIAQHLFGPDDLTKVKALIGKAMPDVRSDIHCPACEADALGTRFATFSYRKALDFPMHSATWKEAERKLRTAHTWTFIGYSLPAADYEFKFMLKRVQLSRPKPPEVIVITGGGAAAKRATVDAYTRFFGPSVITEDNTMGDGLNTKAINLLTSKGILSYI